MSESMTDQWLEAAKDGDDERVAELLAQHPDLIHQKDYGQRTALHYAAFGGAEKVIARLLAVCPALLNLKSQKNFTALDCAAEGGHDGVVAQLLAAKADLITPSGEATPLHIAAANGSDKVAALLLVAKPEWASEKKTEKKFTPLHFAAQHGHENVFSRLLDFCPALIDHVTADWASVLHLAAANGHHRLVERIMTLRPEMLFEFDRIGQDVASLTILKRQEKVAEALLKAEPELVNHIGRFDNTLLHCAVIGDCSDEFVERVLLMLPGCLRHPNFSHHTPFSYAVAENKNRLVDLLQWHLSLDEIIEALNRHHLDWEGKYRPVMEKQCDVLCEGLSSRDVVTIVFEYMGFQPSKRGQKREHERGVE